MSTPTTSSTAKQNWEATKEGFKKNGLSADEKALSALGDKLFAAKDAAAARAIGDKEIESYKKGGISKAEQAKIDLILAGDKDAAPFLVGFPIAVVYALPKRSSPMTSSSQFPSGV